MPRIARSVQLSVVVREGSSPLRHRVADAIMEEIRSGRLRPGDSLPPTRALASFLGVSRSAVVDAYDELSASGFVIGIAGSGTRVAPGATDVAGSSRPTRADFGEAAIPPVAAELPGIPVRVDLRVGYPDASLISKVDWRRSWRAGAFVVPPFPSEGEGWAPELRSSLSTHLRRTRGIVTEPYEIFVLPGALSAIRTLSLAADLRGSTVAVEDPGYEGARNVFLAAGANVRGVPVDEDGLNADMLTTDDTAVYVTPAHQFPLGHRMSESNRKYLLDWARSTGGLIIEDDYDGEFRYDVAPSPALAVARDAVAYVGTASKMLSPTLRVAWLIPPRRLRDRVAATLNESLEAVDLVTGRALSEFIDSGALVRHLARTSRTYSVRRKAFVEAAQRYLIGCRVLGVDSGLHVTIILPNGTDGAKVGEGELFSTTAPAIPSPALINEYSCATTPRCQKLKRRASCERSPPYLQTCNAKNPVRSSPTMSHAIRFRGELDSPLWGDAKTDL
jgi:GntR family transcriptional regulator / MocR family aminotransferase